MINLTVKNEIVKFLTENTEHQYDYLYWYPLNKLKILVPVIAYNLDKMYEEEKIGLIEDLLKEYGIDTVHSCCIDGEYRENVNLIDLLYEKDSSGYNFPWYSETYYYNDKKDFLIYVSHEGTITYTGMHLVELAKKMIPSNYLVTVKN